MVFYINIVRDSQGFWKQKIKPITQLDPLDWNLPYFRFLNKDRAELPEQYWAIKSW